MDPQDPLAADIGPLNTVLLFTANRAEVEAFFPRVPQWLREDGLVWVAYPKGGARVKTDINRDILWNIISA